MEEKNLDPKGHIIHLGEYKELEKRLEIDKFLKNPKYSEELLKVLQTEKDVFYNKNLGPNQGKYLSKAPLQLVQLLDDFCYAETDIHLPHIYAKLQKDKSAPQDVRFALTEKDFKLCQRRTRRNASALKKRIQEFAQVLVAGFNTTFKDFMWKKGARGAYVSPYIPNIKEERGKGPYRNHMWVGFAHKKSSTSNHTAAESRRVYFSTNHKHAYAAS